jgi:ATP-dependent DNA ligase
MARQGVMLAYPYDENRISRWVPPFIVQPKLNGLRCRAMHLEEDSSYVMLSSEANLWTSMPHIQAALDSQVKNVHLDGELYQHGRPMTGPEGLVSIIKRNDVHEEHAQIEYHIFDIINTNQNQAERSKRLRSMNLKPPLIKVPTFIANSLDDLSRIYEAVCTKGYEGIIIRRMDAFYRPKKVVTMMKLKPNEEDVYPIVSYREEISIHQEPKGRLGSLVCRASNGELFRVGSGLNDEQRERYWENRTSLVGKFCQIKYQELTYRGVPWLPTVINILDKNPETSGDEDETESSND